MNRDIKVTVNSEASLEVLGAIIRSLLVDRRLGYPEPTDISLYDETNEVGF